MSDPPTARHHSTSAIARGLVIQGNLEDTALPETIQFLQSLRKTGQLALERNQPRQAASIGFLDGQVVHATCPPLSGEGCFHHLLSWRQGRYMFFANAAPRERSIDIDTGALLLDGLRRLDELERLSRDLPPRDAVLHRRRETPLLERARLGLAHLRLWRRLDGRTTIGAILDDQPECVPVLAELLASGLASTVPDHRFLGAIVLAPTQAGATRLDPRSRDPAARLLVACDGQRSLGDAAAVLDSHPEDVCAAAGYLLALRLAQVIRGADEAALLI